MFSYWHSGRVPRQRGYNVQPQKSWPLARFVRRVMEALHVGQRGLAGTDPESIATGEGAWLLVDLTSLIIASRRSPQINSIALPCAKVAASRV